MYLLYLTHKFVSRVVWYFCCLSLLRRVRARAIFHGAGGTIPLSFDYVIAAEHVGAASEGEAEAGAGAGAETATEGGAGAGSNTAAAPVTVFNSTNN
jgi:hypothetical protein